MLNQNLEIQRESFIESLQLILDAHDLHFHNSETTKAETNTLSIHRLVLGVAYPRTMEQLASIVKAASKHHVALYPVSQGKNIGYGEMTPTGSDQLVVGLKYLNAIREYDAVNGEVIVEPGVTQAQLAQFLKDNNAKFWVDVTGASPEASLIGNTLEAGFGHTPIGDHRKHILKMEVLLADGSTLSTAEMPSIGPDLAQLFVQSNFGIVTAMRIPLFPIPETTLTFAIAFKTDEDFFNGIAILSALRRDDTISSLAHTGNATRALMTNSRFPTECNPKTVLTDQDCNNILNSQSPMKYGAWTCVGALYGYQSDVKNKKKRIQKALKGIASVKFFTDSKITQIDKLINSSLMLRFKSLNFLRNSFASIKALHGITRGQPSFLPSQNIFWRVHQIENLGLIWHAPVIPATAKDCAALLQVARQIYTTHRFEMPLTLTLIDAKHMTAVFNISYDKTNPEETLRAHAAYRALSQATNRLRYFPYRCGLASSAVIHYNDSQYRCLQAIKSALDPQGIMAPGRYGLGGQPEN